MCGKMNSAWKDFNQSAWDENPPSQSGGGWEAVPRVNELSVEADAAASVTVPAAQTATKAALETRRRLKRYSLLATGGAGDNTLDTRTPTAVPKTKLGG